PFFFSSRRRHTRFSRDWSSDVCSSDLLQLVGIGLLAVLAMIALRYRAIGPTLAAFVPALLAGSTALAVLVLAGFSLNLLHVVSRSEERRVGKEGRSVITRASDIRM